MKEIIKTLIAIVAIPTIAYCISVIAENSFGNDSNTDIWTVQWIRIIAIGTAVVGLILYSLIRYLGFLAQKPDANITSLFRTSLYLSLFEGLWLFMMHSVLIIATIWILLRPLGGMVVFMFQCLLPLGIGLTVALLAGIYYIILAFIRTFRLPPIQTIGYSLAPEYAPRLWDEVNALSAQIGTESPRHILVGYLDGFFATCNPMQCVNGKLQGDLLFLPLTELNIFTLDDFRSVVAHELAHFQAKDVELTRRFFPLFRSAVLLHDSLAKRVFGDESEFEMQLASLRYILLTPLRLILSTSLALFLPVERLRSRNREFAADVVSEKIVGTQIAASTLVKSHIYIDALKNTFEAVRYGMNHNEPIHNIAVRYKSSVGFHTKNQRLDKYAQEQVTHPLDTHPRLSERLSALQISFEEALENASFPPEGQSAAELLIPAHVLLEESLSNVVNASFRKPFAEAIKEFQVTS